MSDEAKIVMAEMGCPSLTRSNVLMPNCVCECVSFTRYELSGADGNERMHENCIPKRKTR